MNRLQDCPTEILLHICSYLDIFHINMLQQVCKHFYFVLEQDFIWKQIATKYSIIDRCNTENWKEFIRTGKTVYSC